MICIAYQGTPEKNIELRHKQIHQILIKADELGADFICFPEGFLTGYYNDEKLTRENSLSVHSDEFKAFTRDLGLFRVTIIIGFNEIDAGKLFDSAAVIEAGRLIGVQRKHYQYHEFCSPGTVFVPFPSKGIYFGVVICLDSNYFEPARLCALQGASILFVPCCNKVSPNHKFSKRPEYYSHFAARSHENRCWLVAADWVWENDGDLLCPGHSVAYNSDGQECNRSKEYGEDMVVVHIPDDFFQKEKGVRVHGSKELWSKLRNFYDLV